MGMSLGRRRILLEYAHSRGAWIVEDDYDSEFRFDGRPIASLQGLDQHDRVLYLGTFSKTLFPGFRLGYMVLPKPLASHMATGLRSEEHTSELQSLMRISYAVFCLKKKQ